MRGTLRGALRGTLRGEGKLCYNFRNLRKSAERDSLAGRSNMNIRKALAAVIASLTVACAWAEKETVGTWTYRINGETVEIMV